MTDEQLIDPAWFEVPQMRRVLTARDIAGLYRGLKDQGVSQRRIAVCTGQAQSEVAEILNGRQVRDVRVLERIADGLGIPRGHLRLAGADGQDDGYPRSAGGTDPEVDEEVRRRALIAATSLAALGKVVQGLGELTELALPTAEPLPSRLSMAHVQAVEAVTARLREVARQSGGQAGLFMAAAQHYTRWLPIGATDEVRTRLRSALAELHTEAGWCCYDSGMDGSGYFTRSLKLADEAADAYGIANAAFHAGRTLVRGGHPDDALKAFQFGQFTLDGFQPGKTTPSTLRADDPRLQTLAARLNRSSASAYALMECADNARNHLAKAYDGWAPRNAYDRGVMDHATATVELDLHHLDPAQQFAASAIDALSEAYGRMRTSAQLLLAEVHIRAGEARGVILARHAIEAVSTLQSVGVQRERLDPLIAALDARPGNDARDVARSARDVAAGGAQNAAR
ncbi:MAG: helix-turn-helix domain-containing protein [Pseudonocardiaceae bacterium]